MYGVYVITKNGFDRIHLELPSLALKNSFILKKWPYDTNFVNYEISWWLAGETHMHVHLHSYVTSVHT